MEPTVLAVALLILAAIFAIVGALALFERLPRNSVVGIQAKPVTVDDEHWRAGHKAAAPMLLAAAGPSLLLAVALITVPPESIADWFIIYAVVGVITGGLIALAMRQAERAAEALDA